MLGRMGKMTRVAAAVRASRVPVYRFSTQSSKSWVPVSEEKLQIVTMQSLIHEVAEQQRNMAEKVVPWFLKNMPAAYFRQVPEHLRSQHVKAITALRDLMKSDLSLKMETHSDDHSQLQITYINSQTKTGLLHAQIKSLVVPSGYDLANVNVFSSVDGEVALNIFSFEASGSKNDQRGASREDAARILQYLEDLKAKGDHSIQQVSEGGLDNYLSKKSPASVRNADPRRFLLQREMFESVKRSDSTAVKIEPYNGGSSPNAHNSSWITVASANVLPEVLLRLLSAIISARGLDISRAHLESLPTSSSTSPSPSPQQGEEGDNAVTMLRMLVSPLKEEHNLNTNPAFAMTLARDLKRAKWLDDETTALGLLKHPSLGLDKAEVITAIVSLLHGPLFKADPSQPSFASIKSLLQLLDPVQHAAVMGQVAVLFLDRFNPVDPLPEKAVEGRVKEIKLRIAGVQHEAARHLLSSSLDAVLATLRTNFYLPDRYALSLRLNPLIMMTGGGGANNYTPTPDRPLPFGVLFVHGRHFNAFHNRFRDIARGGLRIVTPANSDGFALESSRQYEEAYGLSYAQQLKNKDIPEGGSKAVVLVNTPNIPIAARPFAIRKSVRAFTDSLLDLIVKDSVDKLGVDLYGKDELIYLGPDEQVIPEDILWIIKRAEIRGYPIPAAFMSSKKDDGFNHKEFGVTSEGVKVYLDVALRTALGINPDTHPFTIKITGGPDGDVAGNLIRILYRDYGDNCKVVGVADGFGVAEDPNGLDRQELMRLVEGSLSIAEFNHSKLSSAGIAMRADNDEGAARRNTMHFRVPADIFVPAGGRPNSINNDNWQQFLLPDGRPSSPLIVEGANIFTTPGARKNLFEKAAVAIVKDSSANKCGVITSSCEVACSMLLSKAEFMAIKPQLVADVLEKLRYLARLEGELLFREYRNYPGALPHFSERISFAIAKVTDAITDALAEVNVEDPLFQELLPLIKENLPKKLAEVAGDRITERLPVQYMRNAIASTLASKLVYQEGIHLIETQPTEKIAERAFLYFRADQKMRHLAEEVQKLSEPGLQEHKPLIVDILKRGGARTSLSIF